MDEHTGVRSGWRDFATSWARMHGGVDLPPTSRWVRLWVWLSYAVGRLLVRIRIRPNTLTVLRLVLSAAVVAMAVLGGWRLFVGAFLVLAVALVSSADAPVALLLAQSTRVNAFYDSIADRACEALWLLALWLLGVPGVLVILSGAITWLHEYAWIRSVSIEPAGGVFARISSPGERPPRVLGVILALVVAGIAWPINRHLAAGSATIVLAVWSVLGVLSLARLLRSVASVLSSPR